MTQRVVGARFRQRKLSTKQNLPVVREHEVEQLADDDASRHIPKVETGVEKGEEIVSSRYAPFGFHSCCRDCACKIVRCSLSRRIPFLTVVAYACSILIP
jgi:hypothetical protein